MRRAHVARKKTPRQHITSLSSSLHAGAILLRLRDVAEVTGEIMSEVLQLHSVKRHFPLAIQPSGAIELSSQQERSLASAGWRPDGPRRVTDGSDRSCCTVRFRSLRHAIPSSYKRCRVAELPFVRPSAAENWGTSFR